MSEPQLLIRRGALGDTILCEPIARAMAETLPDCEVHVAGVTENVALLRDFGPCTKSFSAEAFELWSPERARRRLGGYRRILCDDRALAASLAPELPIVGFDPVLDPSTTRPAAEQLLHRAGFLGQHDSIPRLRLTGEPPNRHERWLLHPGSGSPRKTWPLRRWLDFATTLLEQGLEFEFLIGPVERERGLDSAALRALGTVLEPANTTELAQSLAAARGFIGHDSGTAHLAAALGTPVYAIFLTTDPRVWAPIGAVVLDTTADAVDLARRLLDR
ncbi:MAG: glycosyltransferase family 9 protein [Planctomycetota bacterium]